jgi:zinc protease
MKTVGGKANQIGFFDVVAGDYKKLLGLVDEWNAVTAADVQRVATKYLIPSQRTVVVLDPLKPPAPEAPPAPTANPGPTPPEPAQPGATP